MASRSSLRRSLVWVALMALAATLGVAGPGPSVPPAGAQHAPTYANPVIGGSNKNPFILRAPDGTYYAYVSGFDYFGVFKVMGYSSTDLVTWTQLGEVLGSAGAWADSTSGLKFSSPSVRYVAANPAASRYVLYFTGTKVGLSTKCIGVATAATPSGPFTGASQPLICPSGGAKDASPVPGSDQVVYKANEPTSGIYTLVLTAAGTAVATGAVPDLVLRTQEGYEQDGILERPAVAKDANGRAFLFFRAGHPPVGVGWSPCATSGADITTCGARRSLGSWLDDAPGVGGSGGVQVFSDGSGHQWITYHGFSAGSCSGTTCTGTATLRIDRLCFDHDVPRTNGPTSGTVSTARSTDCSTDIPGRSLAISGAVDNLALARPPEITGRDGGVGVPLGGRLLWLFSDGFTTPACRSASAHAPVLTNSANLGIPHPSADDAAYGSPFRTPECPIQYTPHTANEAYFNYANAGAGKRIILWENGGIPLDDGRALIFFYKGIHDSDIDGAGPDGGSPFSYTYLGQGVARVQLGQDEADRTVTGVGCASTCLFGPSDEWLGRPFRDGGYVYSYSGKSGLTGYRLGRVPIDDVLDRSAWEFRTSTGTWSPNIADAAPVPGLSGGLPENPNYNPYLDRFVNIYQDGGPLYGGDLVKIQLAPDPWGPWTAPVTLHDWGSKECGTLNAYGGVPVPALDSQGGRWIRFTYARPGPNFGADPSCTGQVRLAAVKIG